MPRKATSKDEDAYAINGVVCTKGLGFEDVKDMKEGVISRTFMDDTLPGGPVERTITYHAPFFKMNREKDYARAWKYFEELDKEE